MKITKTSTGLYMFFCPACECGHWFQSDVNKKPCWSWNSDYNLPTVTPSIYVHERAGSPRCHFFVTDGQIRYLDDCGHKLKGQTVDLPDLADV